MLVLSISSLKGGVGKTSVTLGLASAALNRGIPTLVIDADPQADVSTGLGVPVTTQFDIADVLSLPKPQVVNQAAVPSSWAAGQTGLLDVIPGSPRAAEFDSPFLPHKHLQRLKTALETMDTSYRLVLIDTPPSMNGLSRASWMASNRVIIVTEPGLFSIAAADRALKATEELRTRGAPNLQPLGLVLNRVRPRSGEHIFRIDELKKMFGPLVLSPPLPERTVLQQAQGSTTSVHKWPGTAAAELASAFDAILERALRTEHLKSVARPTLKPPQDKTAEPPHTDNIPEASDTQQRESSPASVTDAVMDSASAPETQAISLVAESTRDEEPQNTDRPAPENPVFTGETRRSRRLREEANRTKSRRKLPWLMFKNKK